MEPGLWMFRQRVSDAAQWQKVFYDPDMAALRREHGLSLSNSCVAEDDSDVMVIILTVRDSANALQFMEMQSLSDFRVNAAVLGEPVMKRLGTVNGPSNT